jgi:hypothetical protein
MTMPITPQDYNADAIKGVQLERLAKNIATKINTKQDVVDAEYDSANGMIVLNNINISVASST